MVYSLISVFMIYHNGFIIMVYPSVTELAADTRWWGLVYRYDCGCHQVVRLCSILRIYGHIRLLPTMLELNMIGDLKTIFILFLYVSNMCRWKNWTAAQEKQKHVITNVVIY